MLPKRLLDRPVPYKYVVMRSKEATLYEFIYKPQDKEGKQYVNRCLHLRSALLGSGGVSRGGAGTGLRGQGLPAGSSARRGPTRAVYKPEFGSEFPSV